MTAIKNVYSAYNSMKRARLVLGGISKEEIETSIDSLTKKTPKPKPSAIQLYWLLSAFASSCMELGVQPEIVCANKLTSEVLALREKSRTKERSEGSEPSADGGDEDTDESEGSS